MESLFALVGALICLVVWLIPLVLIGVSDRTSGKEKLAWLLAVVFITWFAWVFYLLLAPLKGRDRYRYS
jgi:membrane protein YdbS with pleckstrin-like domain